MPEEFSRSTRGHRPRRGRGIAAPSWWSRLERGDLPDEQPGAVPAGEAEKREAIPPRASRRGRLRQTWLVYLVLAAAAAFLILVGVGASSTHTALAALLVIGAPLGLAALAGSLGYAAPDPEGEARMPPEAALPALPELATAPVAGMGRIPYASNAVFLVELEARDPRHPEEPLRAVYKPVRGERPLWDFPRHTLHLREVASYLVDEALGLGLIPPTVLREGPLGPGSWQLFVHPLGRRAAAASEEELELDLRRLAGLDVLINNADRKRSHILLCEGPRLQGIDNALTFLPYPRQRTVLLELGGSPLPDDLAARLRRLAGDGRRRQELRRRLAALLSTDEVRAFEGRLEELSAEPRYPVLDPWDGRPFEWY